MKKQISPINSIQQLVFTGLPVRRICSSFFFLILIVTLSGCMKEDYSDCDDETTLTLSFEYLNTNQENILTDYIQQIDVMLFDSDTLFYKHLSVSAAALALIPEVTTVVDPGEYFVIGWGNTGEEWEEGILPAGSHFNDFTYLHSRAATQKGHIYYAPAKEQRSSSFENYKVWVEENGNTSHTFPFMATTHIIHIYVTGLRNVQEVEATLQGVPGGYNYHEVPLWERRVSYTETCRQEIVGEKTAFRTTFYIPHFDNENDIVASIGVEEKGFYEEKRLEEYMREKRLSVRDEEIGEITLVFEYDGDVFLQVTLPDWDNNSVGGGF